jgi:AcrR family transcriptional regulator
MTKPAEKTALNQHTREQLILAAERLISESGIDAVSLRQINVAADQRNNSAAHYHFGSKETLIAAMFEYRMERINRRRLQRLDEVAKTGQDYNVRLLVQAIILPIVDEIEQSEGGSHYIRCEAQYLRHPRIDFFSLWRGEHSDGMQRIWQLLKADLSGVPEIVLGQRFGMMLEMILNSLADREIFRQVAESNNDFNAAAFLNNLIDTCATAVSAPVSSETQLEVDRQV